MTVALSSGHSKYISGAIGLVKEVEGARKITDRVADLVDDVMQVYKFHDNVSRTQRENINRIVNWHNQTGANYHYSFHLNTSSGIVDTDIGVEVLYRFNSDKAHAAALSKAISDATRLKNRGPKQRTNLGFLSAPKRLLIEVYFVNSRADVAKMDEEHEINTCALAIAQTICAQQGIDYTNTPIKPHRVQSGTYATKAQAEHAKELLGKHGIASKEYTRVVQAGTKWRFITGTYASEFSAKLAIEKMQKLNILQVATAIPA